MEIKGKIIACMDKRSGQSQTSGKEWASQDYVIETQDQYPKKCLFSVFGEDKIKEYALKEGDYATVSFDIDAREYNGRWYNDVKSWKVVNHTLIEAMGNPRNEPIPAPIEVPPAPEDDLPF